MIDMEGLDTTDTRAKILLLKKRMLKLDELCREHAQLQEGHEALIKAYQLLEDKEKETAKRSHKYVRGCGRLLKENEFLKKEIDQLKKTVEEKITSMEMLRLENERMDGALKMFHEQKKFLHQEFNCQYQNDRTSLIKFCYDVFKYRSRTDKISSMFKIFQKKYEADLEKFQLKAFKIEKRKGRIIKHENCDSDLDDSVNDFLEEVKPIDSVESGYHENDSVIESVQSKSDSKSEQEFEIREGISLNETSNETWLDSNDLIPVIPFDNVMDTKVTFLHSMPDIIEEKIEVDERPKTPPNTVTLSEFSFSPEIPFEKVGSAQKIILQRESSPSTSTPNGIHYSLYISPVKERLMNSPEAVVEIKPKSQDNLSVARSLSFSPDSSPVKGISSGFNNLRTYEKKKRKVLEDFSELEILGKEIEKNIMGGEEVNVIEKKEVEEMRVLEEGKLLEFEERVEEEVEVAVEVEEKPMDLEDLVEVEIQEGLKPLEFEEERVEVEVEEDGKAIDLKEPAEVEVEEEVQEQEKVEEIQKQKEVKSVEKRIELEMGLEVPEKLTDDVEKQKKEQGKSVALEEEPVVIAVKQVEVSEPPLEASEPQEVKDKQQIQVAEKDKQEEEMSDDELAKIFKEMKMPTLLSPLSITPEVLNREPENVETEERIEKPEEKIEKPEEKIEKPEEKIEKPEEKIKKAKKEKRAKKKVEDEKEWRDALFAVLSLKKKDKTAKAILDVLKKTKEEDKIKKKKKKAKKKKKCSWAVEEVIEVKSSEDENNGGNSPKKNYVRLNFPGEVSGISEEVKKPEECKNVLNEISTQTEVVLKQTNLQEHGMEEILQREEPKILLNEFCTQTEVAVGLPELPGNCLEEFLERRIPENVEDLSNENYCEMVLDLSRKSIPEKSSKKVFNEVSKKSENEESLEMSSVKKAEESYENYNEIVLDLSQKNHPEYNFENLPQTAPNLGESLESPLKSFPEGISENEYLDEFLQDMETCLTVTPDSPPDLEKGFLGFSANNSEDESLKDSEEALKCLTGSLESLKAEEKDLTDSLPKENYHLFSENLSSDDSESNRLRIATDELSEKSSSPSISISSKLISPVRVHKYNLRSSSMSPSTPTKTSSRKKLIDTSRDCKNEKLKCDISDSSDGEKDLLRRSPRTRKLGCKKKRKRRLMEDDLESSSATGSDSENIPLAVLVQGNEGKAEKEVEEPSRVEAIVAEELEDACKSLVVEKIDVSSDAEEISKEVPEMSDSDSSGTRELRLVARETRQSHKKKRKRRKIEDGSESKADVEDPKRMSLSALIQEREDKSARELMKASQPETQSTEKPEDSMFEPTENGETFASVAEEIPVNLVELTASRESISTVEEEIPDTRPKRTLAEIRDSVLQATRSSIAENVKRNSIRCRKRPRVENSSENQVEVCASCLGRCFHKCKRKLKVTDEVQIRLLKNMTHKEATAPASTLQIDDAPEMPMSSGSDSEKKKEIPEEAQKDNIFELDSILTAMTKQKEEFKSPLKKVAVLVPGFVQGQGGQVMQTRGMQASRISVPGMPVPFLQLPGIPIAEVRNQNAKEINIDWKSICDNMNIENLNPIPDENVKMDQEEPVPEKKKSCKIKLKGKRLDDFVKKKLENFVDSNMESNEEATKHTKECLLYLLNVPEDVIVKETVKLILENVDEEIIVFEKPVPPLTKTQQRLLVILSVLQKTSNESQTLIPSILKLINQKLFPERFFWPDDSVESASRFFAALCKHENNFQAIWKFCFNALTEMHQRFSIVIHTVLLVWPDILHKAELIKSNLLTTTFVTLILQTPKSEGRVKELKAQQRKLLALKEILRQFYHFETNNTLDRYLKDLMNELLKGTEKSEESLILFVKCKTFEWLSTFFVPKILEYVNSWAERKLGNDIGIKFLNLLKLMGSKVAISKNLNAKVSTLIACLMEILSSGKMDHSEEEEIVEVLISFSTYVKVGDVLAKWNTKSDISQHLQEKISKAVKEAQKPARSQQPRKPKPKVDKIVNSKKELSKRKRKKGAKKHKKKKSGDSGSENK